MKNKFPHDFLTLCFCPWVHCPQKSEKAKFACFCFPKVLYELCEKDLNTGVIWELYLKRNSDALWCLLFKITILLKIQTCIPSQDALLETLTAFEWSQRGEHIAVITLRLKSILSFQLLCSLCIHTQVLSADSCVFDIIKQHGLSPLALLLSVSVCEALTECRGLLLFLLLHWHQHKAPGLGWDTALFIPLNVSLKDTFLFVSHASPFLL